MATIVDDGESYGMMPCSPVRTAVAVAGGAATATAALLAAALWQLPLEDGAVEDVPAGALAGQADEDNWPASARPIPQAATLCVRLPYLPDPDEIPSADLGGIVSNGWGTTAQSTTGGNLTPGLPAGFLAGDIHLCAVTAIDNGATPSMPAGWTLKLDSGVLGGLHLWIFWHRAAGGDTGPTVTYTGILAAAATISGWRGCVGFGDPFDAVGTSQSFTAQSVLTVNSITTVRKDDALLCFVAVAAADTFSTYAGAAPVAAYSGNETGLGWSLQYKPDVSAAGATGTSSVTPSASATGLGVQVSLLQAAEWMDEDLWQSGVQPVPATLFRELPYLPDPEQEPAGHFAAPSSTKMEEDYEILEFTGPPQPVPASLFQKLPYLPDGDDVPAGKLYGQAAEDFWKSGVAPVPASLFRPLLYLPDADDPPAGFATNPVRFVVVPNGAATALASIDGSSWQQGPLQISDNWLSIAWNGKVFCALVTRFSGYAVCATSPDGITWKLQSLPTNAAWKAIAWNGTVFCAVAGNGAIAATSPTGESLTWTQQDINGATEDWHAITWNGKVFCAIAPGQLTFAFSAFSADGVSWGNGQIGPPGTPWSGLASMASGRIVALDGAVPGTSWYSDDNGLHWTQGGALPDAAASYTALAWNGKVLCAISPTSATSATSTDGITWTPQTLPGSINGAAIAWNGSVFCVVGTGTTNVATSPDGVTWTAQKIPVSASWQAIASSFIPEEEYYWQNPVAPVPATLFRSPLAVLDNEEIPAGSLTVGAFFVIAGQGTGSGRSPDHGNSWAFGTPPAGASYAHTVAWNGKVFVIIGSGPTSIAASSTDGINWTQRAMPSSSDWLSVAWNGQVFCAVAGNATGTSATSADGITWSSAGSNLANRDWRGCTWNGKVFCVVARNSAVAATSPDGVTWTERALPASTTWIAVAWNGSIFSAIAANSTQAATSSDGTTWNSATMSSASQWRVITAKGTTFCAIADSPSPISSTSMDGVSWTEHALPVAGTWIGVGHDGVVFLAVAQNSTIGATSPDGATWTQVVLPSAATWRAVGANNQIEEDYLSQVNRPPAPVAASLYQRLPIGDPEELPAGLLSGQPDEDFEIRALTGAPRPIPATLYQHLPYLPDPEEIPAGVLAPTSFVAACDTAVAGSSIDGASWIKRAMPSISPWTSIAWNGKVFCALGGAGTKAATSPDGAIWTAQTMPGTNKWQAIAWNGSVFCAVTSDALNSNVATSPDGVNWTLGSMPFAAQWSSIAWNGKVFCALAGRTVNSTNAATSTDGLTWAANTLPASAAWQSLVCNGTVFCAIASNSRTTLTSPDGVNWTQNVNALPSTANWNAAAWNGAVFCAVGVGVGTQTVATSPDGVTWTVQSTPVTSPNWQAIAWNGVVFCALDVGTSIAATSPDGAAWTQQALASSNNWSCIAAAYLPTEEWYWQNPTAPVPATLYQRLPILPDAEEIPAGSLSGQPDEDFPGPLPAPVQATLYQRLPVLQDPEEVPAGSLYGAFEDDSWFLGQPPWPKPAALYVQLPINPDPEEIPAGQLFGQPDEDFWALGPPYSAPAALYQRTPMLWDPEQEPAGKLHGQYEDDSWQQRPFPAPARLYQPLPYLPDPEEIPAGNLFGPAEEDFNGEEPELLWGAPRPVQASLYQPLPIGDPEEIPAGALFGVPDELYWQNGPPFPTPAAIFQRLPVLQDPDEYVPPTLYGDEDFWALGPPSAPAALWRSPLDVYDIEEIPAGKLFGQADEDYWRNPVPPVPASLVVPWSPADPVEVPNASSTPATVGAAPGICTYSSGPGSARGVFRPIVEVWIQLPKREPPPPEYRPLPPVPATAWGSPGRARIAAGSSAAMAAAKIGTTASQVSTSTPLGAASGAAVASSSIASVSTGASSASASGEARAGRTGATPQAPLPMDSSGRAGAAPAVVATSGAGGAARGASVALAMAGAVDSGARATVRSLPAAFSSSCAPGAARGWHGPSEEEALMLAATLFGGFNKAAKPKPLDRDRPAAERARAAVKRLMGDFLRAAARAVARTTKVVKAGPGPGDAELGAAQKAVDELDWQPLRDALEQELRRQAEDAAVLGLDQVEASSVAALGQVNELALAWARDHAGELVTNLEATTRDFVRDAVSAAIDEGWSWADLADVLLDSPAFSEERADLVARTEIAFADVAGNLMGWEASGQVAGKRWIVAQDSVCDVCADLDGVEVGLDEPFDFDGEDVDGPPGHPRCRCDVVPVLFDEGGEGDDAGEEPPADDMGVD